MLTLTFTAPAVVINVVLLMVRIVLAVTFAHEARIKFRNIKKFSKNDGVPIPVAYFVATAELCAALGMLSGVLAQWAGVGLVVLMCCTIGLHVLKWHSSYWASKGGWEYDLLMLVLAVVVVAFGAGEYTVLGYLDLK